MKNSIKTTVLTLGLTLLGLAASASASLVPVFLSANVVGGNTVFTYSVNFSTNGNTETLTSGDFFTLYDVGTATSTTAATYTFTQALLGANAPSTTAPDSALIRNLTGSYTGASLAADTTFTATFIFSGTVSTTVGYYSSTDTIAAGKNSQAGLVVVPVGTPIPEPSAWAAVALGGALAVGVAVRRRRVA